MMSVNSLVSFLVGLALCRIVAPTLLGADNADYVTPECTFSPDGRYGVLVPVFHFEAMSAQDNRQNKVVERKTDQVVATINADPGYDRALNFHETAPSRWSSDSSLLLWKVNGKWNPDALVLLKLEQGRAMWQLDLLKLAQQAVLRRTKAAAPKQYQVAKRANAGNGSAFPDGFTIDVTTNNEGSKTVALPLAVQADLSANPKHIEHFPNLDARLDAVVTTEGRFVVRGFRLLPPQPSD